MAAAAAKISFFAKEEIVCPACEERFHREEILSGSGRLIAGELTDELHRLYEPSARYGNVYPLAYQATVCPKCLFASMEKDFAALPSDARDRVLAGIQSRQDEAEMLGGLPDFHEPRTLAAGAVSQYLVMRCYDYYPAEASPTIKQGLAALRAGWLFDHLDQESPGQHYDWLATLLKRKANFFYAEALKRETSGAETLSGLANCGPDTDKNYGYEGILYICGLLEFKYGDDQDSQAHREALDEDKRNLAKMFGLGKATKSRPGPLLEKSRALYENITKELGEFDV